MPEAVAGNVPFKEAIDVLKNKDLVTTAYWDDMVRGEHARAFTIAGVTKIDMLNDFKKSLIEIRERGGTRQDFQKEFRAIAKRYGWEYNGTESNRARVIFETNNRTANAVGRWNQIEQRQDRLKKKDPDAMLYLRYRVLDNSARRRRSHQAWEGITLPMHHPFWHTHYPINDFGCACSIEVLSPARMKRLGIKSTPDADIPDIIRTQRINRTTAEIYPPTVEGIGVGFDHHHGKSAHLIDGAHIVDDRLGNKLADISVNSPDFKSLINGGTQGESLVGFISEDLLTTLNKKSGRVTLNSAGIANSKSMGVSDYQQLPSLIRDGLYMTEGKSTVVYFRSNSKVYKATLTGSDYGVHNVIDTLELSSAKAIKKARLDGAVVREQL